jgi:hypothetical protein
MLLVVSDIVHAMAAVPGRAAAVRTIVLALAAMLLISGTYDVGDMQPTNQEVADAQSLVDKVAALDGDVLCPTEPFLPIAAGHSTEQVSNMGYVDLAAADFADFWLMPATDLLRIDPTWVIYNRDQPEDPIPAASADLYDVAKPLVRVRQRRGLSTSALFALLHRR